MYVSHCDTWEPFDSQIWTRRANGAGTGERELSRDEVVCQTTLEGTGALIGGNG